MSLKATHLIVMACSIIFAFAFGIWAIQDFLFGTKNSLNLIGGIFSLVAGAVMIPYVVWFRSKTIEA